MAARHNTASDRVLVLTRIFEAPRDLVFGAWVEAGRAARWWAPQDCTLLSCEMDVRPGGTWRRRMRVPGGTVLTKHGVWREIVEPERLVFTYADETADGQRGPETLVTVNFADLGGRTELTLHQTLFGTVAARDSHEAGWTSALQRFAEYFAAGRQEWPQKSSS